MAGILGKHLGSEWGSKVIFYRQRQGSGSACRSLYGGFVKWVMGIFESGIVKDASGSDSITVQLANEAHWDDLLIIIAVVSSRQKETSSTTGMSESVETSTLLHHRIINCIEKWNRSEGTPQVAYTFDAGPTQFLVLRLLFFFPPHPDTELNSYVLGDKSILQDAGIEAMKDVEALLPPPEIKDNIPTQKYKGDVSYFICTRPGRGPVLFNDESKSLLHPKTGLPK
ncbi:hypothetical protein HHK36_018035 [Tetracentron sinense]|uniref:Diphosphomevalonate decarboxylase n=1 Tax=Tetracentron sinense TaxID=13715 RepID=A0A834Z0R2_TETSI|nr:hypothetical protein HHK36_018035 [Tetracentron sinense]